MMTVLSRRSLHHPVTQSVILGVAFSMSSTAGASHKIYSPAVEEGEWELEWRGHVTSDDRSGFDDRQRLIFEAGYGWTATWFASLFAEVEKDTVDGSYEVEALAWENIYMLGSPGQYWLDAAVYGEIELALEDGVPNKFEGKLLLEKALRRTLNTLNLNIEKETGDNAEDEVELEYAWRTKWRWKPVFEPAIEVYGNTEGAPQRIAEFGPVVGGQYRLGRGKLVYDFGILFGTTNAGADRTLKWALEYEYRF